ncbi:hypothetical protein ENSA7_62890 [Enhygromyxa salina]|uniref:Uncharacterized protein n=2 Tax=Enhygromyxa salina TaxID=215803 RepID=A0A2S9Y3H6_9BACT|nr:hypothetical protein ENSA7_62890 [Enhygromyxa salina]
MQSQTSGRPPIQIGWVVLEGDGSRTRERVEEVAGLLRAGMEEQLPEFAWQSAVVERRLARQGAQIDPLDLLELGVQEKIGHHWDFALVVTASDLLARERPFTYGVPSSALETAVLSSARCEDGETGTTRVLQLARFLFASLLGLPAGQDGAMRPPEIGQNTELVPFSQAQVTAMRERLADVGDERLEERHDGRGGRFFKLKTLAADPRGILRDVIGYTPWKQPFHLDKLTAAALLSSLLMFLGAEVWELGVGIDPVTLAAGTFGTVIAATWFLFSGQHLSELARDAGPSEQIARTELVLWICLFTGMVTLWLLLGAAAFTLATLLPRDVVEGWTGATLDPAARLSFAAFVSTLGTLAGALGGNLEAEDTFKAQFFFDEEV